MKRPLIIILSSILISAAVFFSSCAIESIDALSTFTFQFTLIFDSDHFDKGAPDTSWDFTHLEDYKEYRDNKGRINEAKILHLNYWIDSLILERGGVFDPDTSAPVEFEFIRYSLQFAKLKPGRDSNSRNINDYEPDSLEVVHLLVEFSNVNIKDFYRNPGHIIIVPERAALLISEALKTKPYFFTITEYSRLKDQPPEESKRRFPLIQARYDMVIRFDVDL